MITGSLKTDYVGTKGRLFRLAMVTSLWTVLTLGIYRFWMKTRLRRFYWSAIRPGGHPLEYVGEPLEKLLGFLIAVVFLSFYIGIVNLILMFLSFSIFQGNFVAYVVSFIGIVPVMFYARYRARRYILARTRWRGVRFGMAPGAAGYAWRAIAHWLITIGSLGLLWPRMTFYLEKYRVDRTQYGLATFQQGGKWTMLYRPFVYLVLGALGMAFTGIVAWQGGVGSAISIAIVATCVGLYGAVHYQVHSFRMLTNHKTVDGVGFTARPRPWVVIRVYVLGYILTGLVLGFVGFALLGAVGGLATLYSTGDVEGTLNNTPVWLGTAVAVLSYFAFFIGFGALSQVFVTLPMARHYAQTLELTGTLNLNRIGQRARDEFSDAEGFAEALDIGAAI